MNKFADQPFFCGSPATTDRIAVLFLQPQCNMTCTFCITEDGFSAMTLDQAVALLRKLQSAGIGNVILGGGEPFFWKHGIMELAAIAKSMGFFVQAGTNGVDLPEGYENSSAIDRYIIPLESPSALVHNSLRRHGAGHHAIIRSRMDQLGRAGKSTTISTVVTRQNLSQLHDLSLLLSGYQSTFGNLHAWHLYRMLPFGRGGAMSGERLDVGKGEYDRISGEVRRAAAGLRIIKRPDMLNSASVGFFWMEEGKVRCRARHPEAFGTGALAVNGSQGGG